MEYGHLELKPRLFPRLLQVPFVVEDLDEDAHNGPWELSYRTHAWVEHHAHTAVEREREREKEVLYRLC